MVADLRAAGLDVDTLDPLVNSTMDIRPGLPILLDWLERAQDSGVRKMIVRALTDRRVRGIAAPALVRAFRRPLPPDEAEHAEYWGISEFRWLVANALSVVADDSVFEDIVELATDRRYGGARALLPLALARMRDPRVGQILLTLLDDPDTRYQAIAAVAKAGIEEARPRLEQLVEHGNEDERRAARRALAALDGRTSAVSGRDRPPSAG